MSTKGSDDWVKVARSRIAEIVAGKSGLAHATLADLPRALDCVEAADALAEAGERYFSLNMPYPLSKGADAVTKHLNKVRESSDAFKAALAEYQKARGPR